MPRLSDFDRATVRRYRIAAGLSVRELAGLLGLSASTVKAWESGRRTPLPQHLGGLADVLAVDVEELLQPVLAPDLAGLRVLAGLTVGGAAGRLGLSRSALQRVEHGERLPPDPAAMCRLYGVRPGVLARAAATTLGA